MEQRNLACLAAAAFLGVTLAASATGALAKPLDVTVRATDPELQRVVSYRDLNIAERPGQKILKRRINATASDLCEYLNGSLDAGCVNFAIRSTDKQFAQAVLRAQRKMAGLPVGPAIAISMVIGVQ